MKAFGWIAFLIGLGLVAASFAVRGSGKPSDIEATTAHLSALLGDPTHETKISQDAADARETARILLLCGLGSAVIGPIFIVAGLLAARGERAKE